MKPKYPLPVRSFTAGPLLRIAAVSLLACTAHALEYTWDGGGGDSLTSTPANWTSETVAPNATNDTLVFAGVTNLSPTNDHITSLGSGSITFANGAGSFNFGGNAITLGAGGGGGYTVITQASANNQTISANLTLGSGGGDRTVVMSGAGSLTLSGNLGFANSWLFPNTNAGTIILSGANSGDGKGGIVVGGTNNMRATIGNNVGGTQLVFGSDQALGNAGSGDVALGTAALKGLQARQQTNIRTIGNRDLSAYAIAINANNVTYNGTDDMTIGHVITQGGNRDLVVSSTGDLTISGSLCLSHDQTSRQLYLNQSGGGSVTVNGTLNDTFHSGGITTQVVTDKFGTTANSVLRKVGTGALYLNGDSSTTFKGELRVENGLVKLGHPGALGPATYSIPLLVVQNADLAEDDPVVFVDDATGIVVGMSVTGDGIPESTTVLEVNGTSVTLSNNATLTNYPVSLTFTGSQTKVSPVLVGDAGGATATLDLNGQTIDKTIHKLEGGGVGGNGALINSNTVTPAVLTADITRVYHTSVGGDGDLTVPRLIGQPNPTNITKVGAGTFTTDGSGHNNNSHWFVNAGTLVLANPTGLGADRGVSIAGGTVKLDGTNPDLINNGASFTIDSGTFDLNGKSEAVASIGGTGGTITNHGAAASTLYVGGGSGGTSTASFAGSILDGTGVLHLTKEGSGTQTLTGALLYSGNTTVAGTGTLSINSASLHNSSTVSIGASAFLNLNHAGTDTVGTLVIDGVPQADGEYGASGSGAQFETDRITGGGRLLVVTPSAGGYADWADDNGASDQTPDEDNDFDGVPNGVEYFMGETGTAFTANPPVVSGSITWPKDAGFVGSYTVQTSINLVNWTDVSSTDNGDSVTYTLPTGETKLFVRLNVTPD